MSIRLISGDQVFTFSETAIRIGRAADNDLPFPDESQLEPYHAVLRCVQGRWLIEAVNASAIQIDEGRPVQFGWVNSGNRIYLTQIGPVLQFETESGPAAPVAAPRQSSAPTQTLPPQPVPIQSASAQPVAGSALDSHTDATPQFRVSRGILLSGLSAILVIALVCLFFVPRSKPKVQPVSVPPAVAAASVSSPAADSAPVSAPAMDVPSSEPAVVSPSAPPPTPTLVNEPTTPPDAREWLVLIGIGDLRKDARPHVLGVGWLWDAETVVVGRNLAKALESVVVAAAAESDPLQACVIQGIPLEVQKFDHPADCPLISRLKLARPAELLASPRDFIRPVTGIDVERMRARDETILYQSYEHLPRSSGLQGEHGMSLISYDPEVIHLASAPARLIYEDHQHLFKADEADRSLERGGLLIDDESRILGMVLLDARVLWTDELQRCLDFTH